MTLDTILKNIKIELNQFETHLKNMLVSEIGLVTKVLSHINSDKAKRLRPSVMFLIAKNVSEINQKTYDNAAMIEILHTATLIHDDVVDNSEKRRGNQSVNAKWNNKIAVLVGDFLFARGMQPALQNRDFEFMQILANVVEIMCEGELLAVQLGDSLDFDEKSYFKIIYSKTASLISGACRASALTVTSDKIQQNFYAEYGKNIGMAFQMKDDIFDFIANGNTIGKPVGNDIRERKITLPLIFALENSTNSQKNEIISLIKNINISNLEITQIIDFTVDKGGIDYTVKKAKEFSQKAIQCLDFLPDSEEKTALINFAEFVVSREK